MTILPLHRSVPQRRRRNLMTMLNSAAVFFVPASFGIAMVVMLIVNHILERAIEPSSLTPALDRLERDLARTSQDIDHIGQRACPLSFEVAHAVDTLPPERLRIVGAGTCEDPLRVEWR